MPLAVLSILVLLEENIGGFLILVTLEKYIGGASIPVLLDMIYTKEIKIINLGATTITSKSLGAPLIKRLGDNALLTLSFFACREGFTALKRLTATRLNKDNYV